MRYASDEIAVCAAVDFPVDVADLIAGHILAMLGKFDAEAMVGTAVEAGDETLDHEAGPELHIGKLRDYVRLKKLEIIVCQALQVLGGGPISSLRLWPVSMA
jgi:hypothetical protein